MGVSVCSLANYSVVAYEETQSNRVSNFRDLCVLCFQKQSFLTFIPIHRTVTVYIYALFAFCYCRVMR